MHKQIVYSLTIFCIFALFANVAKSQGIPKSIHDSIREHGEKVWGIVNENFIVKYGDLNGDGQEDIAVLYLISGACKEEDERLDTDIYKGYPLQGSCGNSFRTYLSVWLGNNKIHVPAIAIADTGWTVATKILSMEDGIISVDILENSGFDPNCCPTIQKNLQFSLKDNHLHRNGF